MTKSKGNFQLRYVIGGPRNLQGADLVDSLRQQANQLENMLAKESDLGEEVVRTWEDSGWDVVLSLELSYDQLPRLNDILIAYGKPDGVAVNSLQYSGVDKILRQYGCKIWHSERTGRRPVNYKVVGIDEPVKKQRVVDQMADRVLANRILPPLLAFLALAGGLGFTYCLSQCEEESGKEKPAVYDGP